MLILHDGSQAWLRTDEGVRCLLTMYDPWDEDHFRPEANARFQLVPHERLSNAARWRRAREHVQLPLVTELRGQTGDLPDGLAPIEVRASDGVVVSAFYREHRKAAEHLDS